MFDVFWSACAARCNNAAAAILISNMEESLQHLVTATVVRRPGQVMGIVLREKAQGSSCRVSIGQIQPDSPFCQTALRPSMEVYSINNIRVRNLGQAVSIMQDESRDVVTVLAVDKRQEQMDDSPSAHVGAESKGSVDDSVDDDDILRGRISVKQAPTVEEARKILQPRPPVGQPSGGVWGTHAYAGRTTLENAALEGVVTGGHACLAFNILCLPEDEEPAYLIDGKVYAADGDLIGRRLFTNFRPSTIRPEYNRDGKQFFLYQVQS